MSRIMIDRVTLLPEALMGEELWHSCPRYRDSIKTVYCIRCDRCDKQVSDKLARK